MDWDLAIRRNREALLLILTALFALVGLPEVEGESTGIPATLPRHLRSYVMRILCAAESAIRRLIVIAAREITVTVRPGGAGSRPDLAFLRETRKEQPAGGRHDFGGRHQDQADPPLRIPAFPLLDPLKRVSSKLPRHEPKSVPRIWVLGMPDPAPIPQKPVLSPDDPVDAAGLYRRLLSSHRALANLSHEARRLARWRARNGLRLSQGRRPGRVSPLRSVGGPPGGRKRPIHEVDDILKECHALARAALPPPDTS